MSLLRFTSDKGRGYMCASVYLESSHVSAIQPMTGEYNRSDNRTLITLHNGLTECVKESPEVVAAMVAYPSAASKIMDSHKAGV